MVLRALFWMKLKCSIKTSISKLHYKRAVVDKNNKGDVLLSCKKNSGWFQLNSYNGMLILHELAMFDNIRPIMWLGGFNTKKTPF